MFKCAMSTGEIRSLSTCFGDFNITAQLAVLSPARLIKFSRERKGARTGLSLSSSYVFSNYAKSKKRQTDYYSYTQMTYNFLIASKRFFLMPDRTSI